MQFAFEHAMVVRRVGAGPEIVWLHGLGESSACFEALVGHPALAGHTHVLPDLPGYGRSPWPLADAEAEIGAAPVIDTPTPDAHDALAAHVDRLAAWLAGRPPPAVIGHSMGGALAILLAERLPLRAVVAIEGNLSAADTTFSGRAAAQPRDEFVARGFAALRDEVGRDPALRGYHAALAAASPEAFYRDARALVALSAGESLARRLAQLPCPAHYLAGVPGGISAHSRGLLDRAGVNWRAIEPAGHWPWVDQREATAQALAAALSPASATPAPHTRPA